MIINEDLKIIAEIIKAKEKLNKIYDRDFHDDELCKIVCDLQNYINELKENLKNN